MTDKHDYIHRGCGSSDILYDSWARWNPDTQNYELEEAFDKGHYCNGCEQTINSSDLEEVPYVPTPQAEPEKKKFKACAECGCTDIESSAWIDVNTGEVSDYDGPGPEQWCPQCEGIDLGIFETTKLKPYQPDNEENE